jgi:formylglycine-generating enzyme required for sulfatase activity/ubiquinone/menaquinone biosynthesis C-methylase UbiE
METFLLALAILGGIATIIAGIAAVAQLIEYLEKRREKTKQITILKNNQQIAELKLAEQVIGFDVVKYREWIKGETEYIDIRGIGQRPEEANVFPILELYTELYVQSGLSNLDLEKGRMRGNQRISLTEMVNATKLLLIMGDPGSGKTTFLKFFARKHIEDPESHTFPVFLRLADIFDYAKQNNIILNSDAIASYFIFTCNKFGVNLARSEFDEKAKSGEWIWLLDSLDELSSSSDREEVVKAIDDSTKRWENCKFVMTSRPLPVRAKSIPIGFVVVGIDYWNKDDIKSFLQVWTKLLFPKSNEEFRTRHWGGLLATILDRSDLRTLAKNAVMVTAMAVVHYNERKLPEGRADLLEALIYWLISAKTRPSNSPYSEYNFIENCYKEIALAMLESEGGRKRRVGRLWAAEAISIHFNQISEALDFLAREETDTGVLVRRGEGDLEFWHLSFQEYLAAKEIAGKTDDPRKGWWLKIQDNLDALEWREVVIFVPLCLNRLGSERVDLFFERLAESCENADLVTKARRVALGGTILRDLKLTGYKPPQIPSWSNLLSDITRLFGPEGEGVPLEIRYQAASAYGLGGDERLRNFEENWIPINGGSYLIGAQSISSKQPNFDPLAAPWEGPVKQIRLRSFEIRRFPITVQEYKEFIDDDGYQTQTYWSDEGLDWLNQSGSVSPLDWDDQLLAPNCPVTGITWFEALAYCNWLTDCDIRNVKYRLPSEAEWEFAAKKGLNGNYFPWGNTVTPGDHSEGNFAWCGLRKKSPIGLFYKNITQDGIVDLFGNVEEWCADSWSTSHSEQLEDGSPITNPSEDDCIVKGGSTIRFSRLCRPTYRSRIEKSNRYHTVGFRPVRVWNSNIEQPNEQGEVLSDIQKEKYVYIESIDYFSIGNKSLWGLGEKETLSVLASEVRGGVWVDLASGDGRYAIHVIDKVQKLLAVDIDRNALRKLHYRINEELRSKVDLLQMNILQLGLKDNSLDGILCTGILHLFPKEVLSQLFPQILGLLKPGAVFILDFGTDIQDYDQEGKLITANYDYSYCTKEAVDFLTFSLKDLKPQISVSSFEDDLSDVDGYGYRSRGNFVLLHGRKSQ